MSSHSEDVVAVAASMHECALELAAFEADFGEAPQLVSGLQEACAQITQVPLRPFFVGKSRMDGEAEKDGLLYDIAPWPKLLPWPGGLRMKRSPRGFEGERSALPLRIRRSSFGKAAGEYLVSIGLYDTLMKEGRLIVMGSVEQAILAATSGGADVAIVSLSLAIKASKGSHAKLPIAPLENSGGLVKSRATENITEFWRYIRSDAAAPIWEKWGFEPVRGN